MNSINRRSCTAINWIALHFDLRELLKKRRAEIAWKKYIFCPRTHMLSYIFIWIFECVSLHRRTIWDAFKSLAIHFLQFSEYRWNRVRCIFRNSNLNTLSRSAIILCMVCVRCGKHTSESYQIARLHTFSSDERELFSWHRCFYSHRAADDVTFVPEQYKQWAPAACLRRHTRPQWNLIRKIFELERS